MTAPVPPPPTGTWTHWLADAALRALIRAALRRPWDRRLAFMGRAMAGVVGPLAGYRRRALRNLALIHPDMTPAARMALADRMLDNFGRTLIENYSWQEFGARLRDQPILGPGLAAVTQAQATGRPVIFVTGHFGNFEAPRQALTQNGFRIGGFYRAADNPYFNRHYAATMTDVSGPVFAKGSAGTLGFVRHLKAGGMATILFDLHDAGGVAIPYLGRPALTSLTAATLALRFGAALVPYWGIRQADGIGFDIHIDAPIPPSDALTMTRAMTVALEARVRRHPEQWFWVHRRWKGVSPAAAPPAPDPGHPAAG